MLTETLSHLVTKLKDEGSFVRVELAFDAEPIDKLDANNVPALMIFPGSYEALERASDNRIDQREDQALGTHMVCEIADFEARRSEVIAALMGFQFTAEAGMFSLVSGETKGIRGSMIWWEEFYSAEAPAGS